MPVSRKLQSQKGFTLVELLIVVAIIGVLSTIGVPTFRKMIQKAKKSEAKVNLGGLYTAESAFFSEYGVYGNAVERIGFEVDGQQLIYVLGFMDAGCGDVGDLPKVANGSLSSAMLGAYPDYAAIPAGAAKVVTQSGNTVLKQCTPPTTFATAPNVYPTDKDPNSFLAFAVGVVSPNVPTVAPDGKNTDVWSITDKRVLANIQDGVGKKQ